MVVEASRSKVCTETVVYSPLTYCYELIPNVNTSPSASPLPQTIETRFADSFLITVTWPDDHTFTHSYLNIYCRRAKWETRTPVKEPQCQRRACFPENAKSWLLSHVRFVSLYWYDASGIAGLTCLFHAVVCSGAVCWNMVYTWQCLHQIAQLVQTEGVCTSYSRERKPVRF